jgi:hypothetical protein
MMKLKYPDSSADFDASPAFLLRDLDVCDREGTLGAELGSFGPNDSMQLTSLLRQYLFEQPFRRTLGVEHKAEPLRILKRSLDEEFCFASLVRPGGAADHLVLPWDTRNLRAFFESLILTAGLALPFGTGR